MPLENNKIEAWFKERFPKTEDLARIIQVIDCMLRYCVNDPLSFSQPGSKLRKNKDLLEQLRKEIIHRMTQEMNSLVDSLEDFLEEKNENEK